MHFGIKPSELHYIFLTCLGTEIINIHEIPSPRQSQFCLAISVLTEVEEACTLYQTSSKAERVFAEHLKAERDVLAV